MLTKMKKNILKNHLFLLMAFVFLWGNVTLFSQAPANYYQNLDGKNQATLKTALYVSITNHTELSYSELWTAFQTTDTRADGKVWDMYSTCNFTFATDQDKGSGGTSECQYYNREHSFPKSWFDDGYPMYTDLFHLYPTDKYVNAQRGNYPFGETSNPTNTYSNGSKKGNSSVSGYTGIVFEPADEYKGDFARTYFYMVTAYENVVSGWYSNAEAKPTIDGTTYPAFNTWTVNMLLAWSRNDPVSQKETNRNNAVYQIQNNRNPYIDFPGIEEYIWGNKKDIPYSTGTSDVGSATENKLKLYSANGSLHIETGNEQGLVYIYDSTGKLIKNQFISQGKTEFEIEANRLIFVKFGNKSGKIITK
jgi:endonuclease I